MRLIVFDLDGTLIDSHAFMNAVMADTFAAEGLTPPTLKQVADASGLSLPLALEKLGGGDADSIDRMVVRYREIFHARVDEEGQELLFPGAREIVEHLASDDGTLLGIATGKALRGVERMLDANGFHDHFVTRQTPDTNPSKPHPGMLMQAMEETGVAPQQVVMIGDSTIDMEMAKAADCWAIGVSWGAHPEAMLLDAGADIVVHSYDDMLPAIDGLLEA